MELFKIIKEVPIYNIGTAIFAEYQPNGMKVVFLKNSQAPIATIQVWYKVGSKNEKKGKTGLAHLFEHMMFRGTKNYGVGVFDHLLEEAGSEGSNAFTSSDYTAYIESIPSCSIELPIKLESDRMVNLDLNQEILDIERDSVLNERTLRVEDDPNGFMWEHLLANLYDNHTYSHDTIGHRDDIINLTVEDCVNFYKKYYSPNNAILVFSGDLDFSYIKTVIHLYFKDIKKVELTSDFFTMDLPITSERKVIKSFDIETPKVLVSFRVPEVQNPDYLPLLLFSVILSGSRSSILKKRFLYTNKVIEIGAEIIGMEHPGIFFIDASLKEDGDPEQFLQELEKTIFGISNSLDQEDLQIAKNRLDMNNRTNFLSNDQIALSFGESFVLTGDPFYQYHLKDKIHTVTVDDIKRVVMDYLKPKRRVSIILLPSEEY
ncbi:insulinase family protein [bacterium]|nr:insulinase family protein [bacterium]